MNLSQTQNSCETQILWSTQLKIYGQLKIYAQLHIYGLMHCAQTTCTGGTNLRSGVIFFSLVLCFFGSRGKKNNARYIHLTSHQPPPYSHNLTSAGPVMLLANQRLPDGNQILAGIMSPSQSILAKRKFLSTFRWRFLKKMFKCFVL